MSKESSEWREKWQNSYRMIAKVREGFVGGGKGEKGGERKSGEGSRRSGEKGQGDGERGGGKKQLRFNKTKSNWEE